MTAGFPAEIRTLHLRNINEHCYRYRNLLTAFALKVCHTYGRVLGITTNNVEWNAADY
jgi:hypothetical protein